MPWEGKPKWSGEYANFGPLPGKMFPVVYGEPLVIQIEGSDDFFFMLFSTEEKLRATTEHFIKKLGLAGTPYQIAKVNDEKMIEAVLGLQFRLMCDPLVVDDHHTKWAEIVKQGDLYKYLEPENQV